MAKYRVVMVNLLTGERIVQDDEYENFDTLEEAEDYAVECGSNFSAGYDVMSLMGDLDEDPIPREDVEFIIEEF